MRRRSLSGVFAVVLVPVASAALVGPTVAQGSRIAVHDLVQPDRLQMISVRDGFVGHVSVEGREAWSSVRSLAGEKKLRTPHRRAMFHPDELSSALAGLMGSEEHASVEEGWLLVSKTSAARAAVAVNLIRRHVKSQEVELAVKLERVGEDKNEVLLQSTRYCRSGEVNVVSDLVSHRALYDFDVEIAQGAVIVNPVVGEISGGASVAVRARPVPRSDLAVLEAVVRVGNVDTSKRIPLGHSVMRHLDRVSSAVDECGVSFLARRGSPVSHEWTSWDGQLLRLTCTPKWVDPPASPATKTVVVGALLKSPVLNFRWRWSDPSERRAKREEPDPNPLRDVINQWVLVREDDVVVDVRGEDVRNGVIVLGGNAAQEREAELVKLIRASLRTFELSVLVLDCAAGQDVGAAVQPPEGARVIGRAKGPVLTDQSVCFAGSLERNFVRDWDAEVAQTARTADPRVDVCEAGYWISAIVTASPVEQVVAVAVECEVRSCDLSAATETLMGTALKSPQSVAASTYVVPGGRGASTNANLVPAVVFPEEKVRIELPVLRSNRIATIRRLSRGASTVVRQAAPNLLGSGRELVVVVSLR